MVINMNKKVWIVIIVIIILIIGGFLFFKMNNSDSVPQNTSGNYEANRTSANFNIIDNANNNNSVFTNTNAPIESSNSSVSSDDNLVSSELVPQSAPQPVEEPLSSFSTKIYSSDSARQNNISITCNTLNGTIIKNDETFSFCSTVGQSTSSKGYEKADVFDQNGNKKKGLGGGNCQISTTLYNAVLAVSSLVVTERHEHSNYVPYIKKGKDAAVAYGSYDLKFRNNSGYDIKIYASSTASSVDISLVSIK